MRAVTTHEGRLEVAQVPDLEPGPGQILLDVRRCGICGSDLHARTHGDVTADALAQMGYNDFIRSRDTVVLGHEFVGTVTAYGPGTRRAWKPGTRVVALPMLGTGDGVQLTGLSAKAPGGYAEQVLVSEAFAFPVPDAVSDDHAALVEPLAVAHHAVRRSEIGRREVAVVVGCGPIGLAVILLLKAAGVRTVVASDPSPGRRELAQRCGADVVVDPRETDPFDAYGERRGHLRSAQGLFDLALGSMRAARRLPGSSWARLMRLAERTGQLPKGPVVFECVGVPGMIDTMVATAPLRSRVIVVGVCMEPDTIRPSIAIGKEIDLRFVFGYDPAEFHQTLQWIASGKVDPSPLITGTVGLDGVAGAFADLAEAGEHAKILIDPRAAAAS
ncbi:zinc-binding dehydrogenase [Nocardioides sp. BP30]|uniref:zinc-binding dehydrogenase n=1 Tax=Nocardioides sp. BP30 TaxID=3036374 RepID=UPI002469234C|nr:zinc-binding dehydrogenase [Nocardioides sp. BP30]WGL51165.1 zinc-binding dehydrogenase [Nocardioides sp. BP30]